MTERSEQLRRAVARNWALGMLAGPLNSANPDTTIMVAGFGEVTLEDCIELSEDGADLGAKSIG